MTSTVLGLSHGPQTGSRSCVSLSLLYVTARETGKLNHVLQEMAVVETHEPLPRFAHRAAAVGGKAYVWGGRAKDFHDAETRAKLSLLESFDPLTELWLTPARGTTGDHPPGLYDGAIAVAGGSLYHYGGYDGASFFNALSKSDISEFPKPNSNWSLLSSVSTGPMRKVGCGMVYFERALLCVVGGYGELSGPIQLGAIFMESGRRFSGRGWTNELHFFHLSEGRMLIMIVFVWGVPAHCQYCSRKEMQLVCGTIKYNYLAWA